MKTFTILGAVFLMFALFTSNAFSMDLNCVLDQPLTTTNEEVTNLVLTNVEGNESQLESNLPDTNTVRSFEEGRDNDLLVASFSNGCDNMYGISFPKEQFTKILFGGKTEIRGEVSLKNSSGLEDKQKIYCRRSQ